MSVLGSFSENALEAYQQAIAEQKGMDFSESGVYNFTRCVRPNNTAYGTRGKCKKGTEEAKTEDKKKLTATALKKLKTKAEGHALDMIGQTREELKDSGLSMSWAKRNSGTWELNVEEKPVWMGTDFMGGDSATFATISPKGRLTLLDPN